MNNERIILAGGSGFLGQRLARWFAARKHVLVVLTRSIRERPLAGRAVQWDGRALGAWEKAFNEARTPNTRKVILRTAMVLGHGENSVFPVMRRLVGLGLGGRMAGGSQFVSWIHEEDFCRAVEWLLKRDDFSGPVNLAAPNPLPNREMMRLLRRACDVPVGLLATLWMLEVGALFLRTETELIIKSRKVVPGRLLGSGFKFHYPEMEGAVRQLAGSHEALA